MVGDNGGILISVLDQVDTVSQEFVFQGYQNLVAAYSPAIYGLAILSLIIFGYAILHGWVQLSLNEIGKRALMIGIILALAMNWGNFSNYVYALFVKAPNEIATHIIQSIPGTQFHSQIGVNAALQQAFYEGMSFVKAIWDRGGLPTNIGPYVWAMFTFMIVMLLVGIALIELVIAKFGLAIYLVLSPLIIPLFFFETTKSAIFDGWFKHLITFAFIPIFITSAMALGLMLMSSASHQISQDISNDTLTITDLVPYELYSFICIGLLIKSTFMAASTAGGFATGISHRLVDMTNSVKQLLGSRGVSGTDTHIHVQGDLRYSNAPSTPNTSHTN